MRAEFEARIMDYKQQGRTLIYIDESGFAKDAPRTQGYSYRGERCYGQQDWQARGRVNAIGAIINFVFLSVGLFNANIDSDIFYAWLTQELLPKVPAHSVLVMDNATFHKREDMKQAISNYGCTLEFLPTYSPDLNPIEKKWAQVKAARRKYRCDDIDSLFKAYMQYDNL